MDRASWLKLFERWLESAPAQGNAGAVPGRRLPVGTDVLVPAGHCPDSAVDRRAIRIAVAPDDSQHERVHCGHYLIPDIEACVLCGDEGIILIPWPNIIWVRT